MTTTNKRQLAEIAVGETFKLGDVEFIKLTDEHGASFVTTRDILYNEIFDNDTNNFAESNLLRRINDEIVSRFRNNIHAENMLEFETDLLSLDGDDMYETVKSKVSLPTFGFYRKHVKIFDRYRTSGTWWLATPWSTPRRGGGYANCCVRHDSSLGYESHYYNYGVRPLLLLDSSMFVKV